MIVRELLAKFGFEVDTSKAEQFKKTINDVKFAINTIAVGKLNQWATELEVGFQQANRQLQALTDSEGFQLLQQGTQKNSDQFGLSKKSLLDASKAFLEITSNAKLANNVMDEASRLSTIYAQSPKDVMAVFGEFVASGATEGMKELGLLTHQQLETLRISGREYGIWTTKARETELINILLSKSEKHQHLYNLALKDSGIQTFLLREQFKEWSKGIGEFLNPAIAKTIGYLNQVFKNFRDSEIGKTTTKILAIGGGFLAVVSAIALAEKGVGLFLKMFSGGFGKLALAAFLITAIALVAEDLWTFFTNPEAETWIGTLTKTHFPELHNQLVELQKFVNNFSWEKFKSEFKTGFDEYVKEFEAWQNNTLTKIKTKWGELIQPYREGFENIKKILQDIQSLWNKLVSLLPWSDEPDTPEEKAAQRRKDKLAKAKEEREKNRRPAIGPRTLKQQQELQQRNEEIANTIKEIASEMGKGLVNGAVWTATLFNPLTPLPNRWDIFSSTAPSHSNNNRTANITMNFNGITSPLEVKGAVSQALVESGIQATFKQSYNHNTRLGNTMKTGGR